MTSSAVTAESPDHSSDVAPSALVESVAQVVIERMAFGNKVSQLTDRTIARMAANAAAVSRGPRKLILKCTRSASDAILLTAAVRDLHLTYPGQFITDVRTSWPRLWENNPYLTALSVHDPDIETIDCQSPMGPGADHLPYHAVRGYALFLDRYLGLQIQPHAFKPDIHLSSE